MFYTGCSYVVADNLYRLYVVADDLYRLYWLQTINSPTQTHTHTHKHTHTHTHTHSQALHYEELHLNGIGAAVAERVLEVTERIMQEASSSQPMLARTVSQEVRLTASHHIFSFRLFFELLCRMYFYRTCDAYIPHSLGECHPGIWMVLSPPPPSPNVVEGVHNFLSPVLSNSLTAFLLFTMEVLLCTIHMCSNSNLSFSRPLLPWKEVTSYEHC